MIFILTFKTLLTFINHPLPNTLFFLYQPADQKNSKQLFNFSFHSFLNNVWNINPINECLIVIIISKNLDISQNHYKKFIDNIDK